MLSIFWRMWSQELRLILQVIVLKHLEQIDTRFPLERKYLHELYMHTNVYFLKISNKI